MLARTLILLSMLLASVSAFSAELSEAEKILIELAKTDVKAKKMLQVLRDKRDKFPNLAAEVEMFVFQVAAAEFFPRTRIGKPIKPIVIVGPPSIGKTTMIKEVVAELELEKKFIPVRVRENTKFINFSSILLQEGMASPTGVQAVFFVDEIQNMTPAQKSSAGDAHDAVMARVNALAEGLGKLGPLPPAELQNLLKAGADSIQQLSYYQNHNQDLHNRQNNDYLLWHLTGNGIVESLPYPAGGSGDEKTARAAVDPALRALENFKTYLEQRKKEVAAMDEGHRSMHERDLADPIRAMFTMRSKDGNNHLPVESAIRYISTRPHLYRELLKGRTIPRDTALIDFLFQVVAEDPEKFAKHVRAVIDKVGFDKDIDAGRVIIIISGNDQDFQNRVKQRVRERGGNPENPNDYHNASQEIIREEGAQTLTEGFLEKHLGTGPNRDALMSRLATSGHKPTLTEEQVKNLIRYSVKDFDEKAKADLAERGIHLESLKTDDKLIESLFQRLKKYHQDPRRIVNEIGAELSLAQFNLLPTLIETAQRQPGLRPEVVVSTAGPNNNATITVADTSQVVNVPKRVEVAVGSAESGSAVPSEDMSNQSAVNRAGYATISSLLFGSVPKALSLNAPPEKDNPQAHWNKLDVDSLRYRRNEILSLLAGMAAENEFTPDLMPSERAVRDSAKAEQLLQGLLGQLREMNRQRNHEDSNQLTNRLGTILPGISDELIFRQIDHGEGPEKVLQIAMKELRSQLRSNRLLVAQLGAELKKNDTLTGVQMQPIFSQWLNDGQSESARAIVSNEPGKLQMELCTLTLGRVSGWERFTRTLGHRLSLLKRAFVGG